MKKYKHKVTGELVERSNYSCYISMKDSSLIPDRFVEGCNDWEEVIEKSYEILSLKYMDKIYNITNEVDICGEIKYRFDDSGFLRVKDVENHKGLVFIYSIKRESDGEVFTVGDKIDANPLANGIRSESITCIELRNDWEKGVKLTTNVGASSLESAKKYKEPILTTEDGVNIYEGDRYWLVDRLYKILQGTIYSKDSIRDSVLARFSTKEKAEEYVLMNKPCLSLKDLNLLDISVSPYMISADINELKRIVKSRIHE